jgi:DNA-binding protein HU-beta
MTKLELVQKVVAATGQQRKTVEQVINTFIFAQKRALIEGKNIYIRGFGSLNITTRQARTGQLIKAGEQITIPPHKIIKFKASPKVKAAVKKLPV